MNLFHQVVTYQYFFNFAAFIGMAMYLALSYGGIQRPLHRHLVAALVAVCLIAGLHYLAQALLYGFFNFGNNYYATFSESYFLKVLLRYGDWLLTTSILTYVVLRSVGFGKALLLYVLGITLNISYIVIGYIIEVLLASGYQDDIGVWLLFVASCVLFLLLVATIFFYSKGNDNRLTRPPLDPRLEGVWDRVLWYVLVVWSLYPVVFVLGLLDYTADTLILREALFNILDFLAKIIFALFVILQIEYQQEENLTYLEYRPNVSGYEDLEKAAKEIKEKVGRK